MSARADAEDVIELLQSDVARNMGALGAPNLDSLSRSMVRVHQR
jgi:isopentenyl diphosphate isomerase/L-lactate dehydrogenase-like FMN-dependent dehydrogenase